MSKKNKRKNSNYKYSVNTVTKSNKSNKLLDFWIEWKVLIIVSIAAAIMVTASLINILK